MVKVSATTHAWSRIGSPRWRVPGLTSAAFLADGRIAVASSHGTVQLLTETGEVVSSFGIGDGMCDQVAVHPLGRTLAIGATLSAPAVVLLDVTTGSQKVLKGHQGDRGPEVAWSADGEVLITGDDEGTVRLFTSKGERTASYSFKPYTIRGVAIDVKAGVAFVTAGLVLYRLELETGERHSLKGEGGGLALSGDGGLLASASYYASRRRGAVWVHPTSGGHAVALGPPRDAREALPEVVRFAPNGQVLAGYDDGALRLWGPSKGVAPVATLTGHGQAVVALAVSPDGRRAISGSNDGVLALWDLSRRSPLSSLDMPTGPVRALQVSGGRVHAVHGASAQATNETTIAPSTTTVSRWDRASAVRVWQHVDAERNTHSASFGSGGAAALVGTERVVVVSEEGKRVVVPLPRADSLHAAVSKRSAALVDSRTLALTAAPLTLVDLVTAARQNVPGRGAPAFVAVSGEGHWAITRGYDNTMALFDLRQRKMVKAWAGLPGRTRCFALSPSGQTVLTGEWGGLVRRWSTGKAAPLATWTVRGSRAIVEGLVFVDDATALTLSGDGLVCQWNVGSDKLVAVRHDTFPGAMRAGFSVATAIAFGEGTLAVGGEDGVIELGAVVLDATVPAVRSAARRSLPFALSPSYEELVAGSLGLGDYEEHWPVRIEYAKAISVMEKRALGRLYGEWGDRLRRAAYASMGYSSEEAALDDGHPPVRVDSLTVKGKLATGGASRVAEAVAPTRWLVEALTKRRGIASVRFGTRT